MKAKSTDIIMQNQAFPWIALGTALILSIPLIAMQFSEGWNWSLSDFVTIGILLFGTGFAFVHITRVTPKKYRILIGLAFLAVLLYVWAELAVGVFTNIGS